MAKSDLTHFWHTLNWFDIFLTHFISKQNGKVRFDIFLTYSKLIWHSFDILINFWHIFDMCQICVKTLLTLFWHTKYMSKLFLTHVWHIFDTFLTYKFLQGQDSESPGSESEHRSHIIITHSNARLNSSRHSHNACLHRRYFYDFKNPHWEYITDAYGTYVNNESKIKLNMVKSRIWK